MSDGNKRYLGDVFINEDNYEYQKQFFRDIIESYQWKYGGNFDASTLQEKTPEDFATSEQGAKADMAILAPLLLGRTEILNVSDSQYIVSDAIKIDRNDDFQPTTQYDNLTSREYINLISWFDDLNLDATLSEMLYTLYSKTIEVTDKLDADKVNKSTFQELKADYDSLKESILGVFETFTDEHDMEVVKLNADLVNGLRFRLITQSDYDNLSNAEKTYWRNIFIIKDPGDIPPLYEDPMQWSLTDGYEFRISNSKLQVKNELSDNWADICDLSDLLNGANIRGMVQEIMEEDIGGVITDIQPVDVESNWENYPFLSSSLHETYIKDVLIDNDDTYVTSHLDENDSLKYVNIDMEQILIDNEVLDQNGLPQINNIKTSFDERLQSQADSISALNTSVNAIQNDNTQKTRISALETKVTTLNTAVNNNSARISSLESNVSNKQDTRFRLLYYAMSLNHWHHQIYTNGTLCYFWLRWIQTNMAKEPYNWSIGTSISESPFSVNSYLPESLYDYRPLGPVTMTDFSGAVQFTLRDTDARLYLKSLTGKTIKSGDFYASTTYVARRALE